jgi:hypothetical protein
MKQIRAGVFETNSSSSHSISISNENTEFDLTSIKLDYDKHVVIEFDEFGWGYTVYTDAYMKFKYLCTMWFNLECYDISNLKKLYKTSGFKILNKAVKKIIPECKGLIINRSSKIFINNDYNGSLCMEIDGYIDHQSVPWSRDEKTRLDLEYYLNSKKISAEDFIFSKNVELIIDNDNH